MQTIVTPRHRRRHRLNPFQARQWATLVAGAALIVTGVITGHIEHLAIGAACLGVSA